MPQTEAAPKNANNPPSTAPRSEKDIAALLLRSGTITPAQASRSRRVKDKLPNRSLLQVVQELGYASEDATRKVLQDNRLSVSIGTLLVELGYITPLELEAALEAQRQSTERKKLGEILVEKHFIDEQRLMEVLSMQLGFPQVNPEPAAIDRQLLGKVNLNWCRQHLVAPMRSEGDAAMVAMANPLDGNARDTVLSIFGQDTQIGIAGRREIIDALAAIDQTTAQTDPETALVEETVVDIVNRVIAEALSLGVSDIHFEPLRNRIRIRYRRDGVMETHREYDAGIIDTLTARLKIMANVGISDKRKHQDGRMHFEDPVTGQSADLRVSFYATLNGQKIVLRILNRKAIRIDIRETGLAPRVLDRFIEEALDVPSGVILITGPTGSGKTTTLYGAVNYLNNDETSIVTAEDPVEYVVDGIAQCSINPQLNITFEETLRHIVRQDPDVIVLGEIRDNFSAEAAIQAALTGHKVLTTFHTEGTIGGLLRLMNMDIETFLISSTVVSVLAQRLLRRVCSHCAQPYKPTPAELRKMGYSATDTTAGRFMHGKGCEHCRYSGYSGRVGIFELLVLNEDVKTAIRSAQSSSQIRRISMETSGLVTLLEDGIAKAALGQTTIAEVLKNLPRMEKPRPIPELFRLTGLRP